MKIDTIQTSFVAGELAPALFGRTDIAQYANACAIVENFLIRPYGPLISTPGTEYISECKTGGSTSIARAIPFVFSRTDAYVIEMGVGYFRFFTNGAVVVSTGTTPYEVAHTYTAAEIPDIHYCQLNDVIFKAHSAHPQQKLTRLASNSWTLTALPFIGGPFAPDNVIYSGGTTTVLSSATITPSATTGSITLSASSNIFISSGSTLGHKNTYWKIGATRTSATTGLDVQGYVQITAITNPSTATATVVQTLSTASATTSWAQGSWSDVLGWPSRVTFHQQRLVFARTLFEPQNIWMSKSFRYEDFAVDGGNDDDAINIRLASTEANDIKWLAPGTNLVAGTYGGEFSVGAGDGSPLTPANTNVIQETSWGSEAIIPKKIGNFLYYVQRFGKKLRELFFNFDLNSYKSVDKTILSPHIAGDKTTNTTMNTGFIDLAYQQNPDTILWAVCSNGTLATMTREVDQEVQGWARQTTDGYYESIATIPSQTEPNDEVWVIVKRTINGSTKRYVERFKSQKVPDRQDQCWYVHSGLDYSAFDATAALTSTTITLPISAMTVGTTVTITASAAYFTANDVGQRIRAVNSSGTILGELLITARTSSTVVVGQIKYAFTTTGYSAGLWGVSVSSISGLNHLEAKTITVLGDGGTDKPNKTVSNGSITLAYDYFIVIAGLPYTQKIRTLAQEAGSQRGTSQGKIQRINQLSFKVNRSHKGFTVGGTEDETDTVSFIEDTTPETIYTGTIPNDDFVLERISFRDPDTPMGTPEVLYTGTIPNISFRDDYKYGSQVWVQNSDPLPIEILAIITTIDTNDK